VPSRPPVSRAAPGASPSRPPRSLAPVIWILLVTLAPILAATLVYYNPQWWPEDTSNYGELIEPQRPIPAPAALVLKTLQGQPFDLASLTGKWLLVAADGGECPEECARKLFITRNAHASLGKNVDRVARVWFITDDAPVPDKVLEAYRGTVMVRAKPEQVAAFLLGSATAGAAGSAGAATSTTAPVWPSGPTTAPAVAAAPASAATTASTASSSAAATAAAEAVSEPMWLIDPLGHLMMQFPAQADPIRVRDDLRKLIANSRIG
jgi:hypothetical protein